MIGLPPDESQLPPRTSIDDVLPLRLEHVWSAAVTWEENALHDPVDRYVTDEVLPSNISQCGDKLFRSIVVALSLNHKVALTTRHGTDWILVRPPPRTADPRRPIDRTADNIVETLNGWISRKYGTPEQRKRNAEYESKIRQAIEHALGDRVYDMFCILTLAARPNVENSSGAHSLLAAITNLADVGRIGCWVQVSRPEETAFYQRHGFDTVIPVLLGDDNPHWPKEPVVVQIMVREPHTGRAAEGETRVAESEAPESEARFSDMYASEPQLPPSEV